MLTVGFKGLTEKGNREFAAPGEIVTQCYTHPDAAFVVHFSSLVNFLIKVSLFWGKTVVSIIMSNENNDNTKMNVGYNVVQSTVIY